MITPNDKLPVDDAQNEESQDQQSQKDIHGNGLENQEIPEDQESDETGMLEQAYEASEPSFTLNLDDEAEPEED